MITTSRINEELERCKSLRQNCKRRARSTSCRTVFTKPQHGKARLYATSGKGEQYIPRKNPQPILEVLQSQILHNVQYDLSHNIDLLEKLQRDYVPLDMLFSPEYAEPVLQSMMQTISGTDHEAFWRECALKFLQNELYPSLQSKPTASGVKAWLEQPYKGNPSYLEQKIHCSPGGVWVRSKSELLIKSELEYYRIPHKYECPLQLEDEIVYPDFTVLRMSDLRILYWEHLGKMDDPKYASRNIDKVFRYFQAGYLPFENLILTYDREGTLDMRQVERVMKMLR